MSAPLAREDGLTIEELGDGLLVYDLDTDRAHSLSPTATQVWRACDGQTHATALAARLALGADQVTQALDELEACELLAPGTETGLSRRELSVRIVKGAAAAASLPLIVSIVAPTPAAALTPGCEAIGACLTNCGSNTFGCKNDKACTCCQLNQINCPRGGGGVQRSSNVKFCAPGTAANCPPVNDPTRCTTPCPSARQSSNTKTEQPPDTSAGQPSTPTGDAPQTPESPPPPEPPPSPTTPSPETPTTPEPTTLDPP